MPVSNSDRFLYISLKIVCMENYSFSLSVYLFILSNVHCRYRDPCSASIDEDDLHTTKLVGDPQKRVSMQREYGRRV